MGKRWLSRHVITMKRFKGFKELLLLLTLMSCMFLLSTYILDSSSRLSSPFFKGHHELNHQTDNTLGNSYHYVAHEPWNAPLDSVTLSVSENFDWLSRLIHSETNVNTNNNNNDNNNNRNSNSPNRGVQSLETKISQLLRKLDESITSPKYNATDNIVIVRSKSDNNHKDISILKWALRKHGFTIQVDGKPSHSGSSRIYSKDWILLICLDYSQLEDGLCLIQDDFGFLENYQKIDHIPGLRNLLASKESFCSTIHEVQKVSIIRNPFSPLCFILPHQYQTFLDVSEALGYSASWALKIPQGLKPINVLTDEGRNELRDYAISSGVIQKQIDSPLLIFGLPVTIRQFVAITSIEPFRAYIHSEGFVYHADKPEQGYQKTNGRLWSASNFWEYIAKNYGHQNVTHAQKSIKSHICQLLLVVEALLLAQIPSSRSPSALAGSSIGGRKIFQNAVQLIAVDVTLNSTLDSWILGVSMESGLQHSSKEDGFLFTKLSRQIFSDYVGLITTRNSALSEVETALKLALKGNNIGIMGLNCHITHEVCLSSDDLKYLLDWRREMSSLSGFQILYPTSDAFSFHKLIEETSSKIVKSKLEKGGTSLMVHRTWDLHSFLMQMDLLMTKIKARKDFLQTLATESTLTASSTTSSNNEQSDSESSNLTQPLEGCSQDISTLPYISSLNISPRTKIYPNFTPKVTQYFGNVSHDVLLVTIFATAQHCQSEVRIEGKFGPSRPTNYTLGLGQNKIVLVVVDVSQAEPMVINTYNLYINRLPLIDSSEKSDSLKGYQVCFLKQDCDLPIYPRETCGLQKYNHSNGKNWLNHVKDRKSLKFCESGGEPGKWTVPCLSCKQVKSCIWSQSRWEPDTCQYQHFTSNQISDCLNHRKILFIGDSTNRGLMHYLMERLNGSLTEGNKTHELRIYQLNHGQTLIGFNYYPKFWLPIFQRVTFDKTVEQLIKRAGTLSNSTETVLIFGGVQWTASQHIHLLLQSLSNLKLTGIKVIMKTIGAGFHQKIEGIHSLTLEDQQKLAAHNRRLVNLAKTHNIDVVDTFNITISRYKDFYPGKCLCHFHQAIEIQENLSKGRPWTRYHIDGDINAACGEILINQLCHSKHTPLKF